MKLSVVLILSLCAFAPSTSAWTLYEAGQHVISELRPSLDSMIISWEYFTINDELSCGFVQYLVHYWEVALAATQSHPAYVQNRNDMHNAGLDWDNLMVSELQPSMGYLPAFQYPYHLCPMEWWGADGGLGQMRTDVTSAFNNRRTTIDAAVATARAQSPEYNAIYNRNAADITSGTQIRCSDEMKDVERIMTEHGFDLVFFLDMFRVTLGMHIPATCP